MVYQEIHPKWNADRKQWTVSIMRDGKRKQFSCSTPKSVGKAEVRRKALEWLEQGETNESVTLADAYGRFLKDYELKNGQNSQLVRLKSIGKNHIVGKLGKRRVGAISLEEWQDLITNAHPIGNRTDPLTKKYLKNIRETVILFMNWATPRKYMSDNYAKELFIPKNAPTKGKKILQLSDLQQWFSHPTGYHFERALFFEVLTGCRPGEVLGIRHEDFDPLTGVLSIQRAINSTGQVTEGKNENARRKIALVGEVRQIFEEQQAVSRQLRSEWVFCSPFGQMPSQRGLVRCMQRIDETFLFDPEITPYSLRHTFFTLVEGYLPSRTMKAIFGHSDATESHTLYGQHEIDGEVHEASRQLSVTPLYQIVRKVN